MANTLADVQYTFTSLDQQYNQLLAACRTQADRDALGVKYATAQAAYLVLVQLSSTRSASTGMPLMRLVKFSIRR